MMGGFYIGHEDAVIVLDNATGDNLTILILCVALEHCHHLIVSFTNPITTIPTS